MQLVFVICKLLALRHFHHKHVPRADNMKITVSWIHTTLHG